MLSQGLNKIQLVPRAIWFHCLYKFCQRSKAFELCKIELSETELGGMEKSAECIEEAVKDDFI